MGSSKSSGKVQVSEFSMSIHLGVCAWRRSTEILRLYVGEKETWSGQARQNTALNIDKQELFGGLQREGGLRGTVDCLLGGPNQVLPDRLATRLGRTSATAPGFRGLLSLFFTGQGNDGGFVWGANNPYLRPVWVRVRAIPQGLNPATAMIQLPNDSKGYAQYAANPAHIIFECLTNREWGMGASLGSMDVGSYERAAQTLYEENFGLAMVWTRQTEIENFVSEVIDHIHAVQFQHPETGKHTLRLLRDDYNINALPTISVEKARLTNYKRKLWGETTNEISVTWTNPENEQEMVVTSQDLAAVAMQGGVVADSKNYYGVRSEALAIKLAERDLAMMSAPIATMEAEVDRTQWRLVPGDVVRVVWPEHGVEQLICRVLEFNRGSSRNSRIRLNLNEDVFAANTAVYGELTGGEWVDPSVPATPLTNYTIETAPAFMAAQALGLNTPGDLAYPEAVMALAVGANTSGDVSYELMTVNTGASGGAVEEVIGERPFIPSGVLQFGMGKQSVSVVDISDFIGRYPKVDDFLLISDDGEDASEIALVTAVNGLNVTLWRGVLDTVPRDWGPDTRVWVMNQQLPLVETTIRVDGETVQYKLLPRTNAGLLPANQVSFENYLVTERPHRPLRPANIFVNGIAFSTLDATGVSTFNVSWSRRNRLVEVQQVIPWFQADVSPETGQTVTIELLRTNGTLITSITGLTGTEHDVLLADFDSESAATIRVISVRDGFESLQGFEVNIINLGV